MLILLICTWLLGGGGSGSSATVGYVDQINAYANGHLPDKAQRQAVLETAKRLKKAGKGEAQSTAKAGDAVERVAQNRGATPEDFERTLSEMRGYSVGLQDRVLALRGQLKSELTREQWAVLHSQ